MYSLTKSDPKAVLADVFGHQKFRGQQEQVIQSVLSGRDGLILMPTGMGKSLCYQLPSQILPGVTLVISPLIALMNDQAEKLQRLGLKARTVHSLMDRRRREEVYRELAAGQIKLLLVTPERFRREDFLDALESCQVSLLAVDEAHCISQWGHDFRPDYRLLKKIRERLGQPPTLALTATATPAVQKDILASLGLGEKTPVFDQGLKRDNLFLAQELVHGLDQKIQALVMVHHLYPGPKIVYSQLISTLHETANELSRLNFDFEVYHGQMKPSQRNRAQKRFLSGQSHLILATPAFGLGVDKPDVRAVVHLEIPSSLESYYQEVGRGGRDGKPCLGLLLYDGDDVSIQTDFIKWSTPEPYFVQEVYRLIAERGDELASQGTDFLRKQLNFYNRRDFRAETSLRWLESWGCIEKTGKSWKVVTPPSSEIWTKSLWEQQLRSQKQHLLDLVQYAQAEVGCRKDIIYSYFGLQETSACGYCDLCDPEGWKSGLG